MFAKKIKTEKNFCEKLLEIVEKDLYTLLIGKENRYIVFLVKIGLGDLDGFSSDIVKCMEKNNKDKELKNVLKELIEFVKQNIEQNTLVQIEMEELGIIIRRRFQKIDNSQFHCRLYKVQMVHDKKIFDKVKLELKEKPKDETLILIK